MIPKECKRLIEVDFPIATVSKYSAREKSIRHGHPSTLHLWWARRPLAACRAVLMGLLLPDPCDSKCPEEFRIKAREILKRRYASIDTDEDLRKELLNFIGDFSNWDNANDQAYIQTGRDLVKAAHPEEKPLVVDPFAGGGSIPLEALRLGCDAFASDLNPVACLIEKVMLEDIPRHGPKLAEELRKAGTEIKAAAEKELAEFYPPDPDGAKPIAYLWARTVRCEAPDCGAEIPLMRSFWLAKNSNRRQALRLVEVDKAEAMKDPLHSIWGAKTKALKFEIFSPQKENDVRGGTVSRAKATCPCCERSLPPLRVRAQLASKKGGADTEFDTTGNRIGGARLLAVVRLKEGEIGRRYRLATVVDYKAVWKAQKMLEKMSEQKLPNGLSIIPDENIPGTCSGFMAPPSYGMKVWGDIYQIRQKMAFASLVKIIGQQNNDAIKRVSSMICTKLTDRNNSLVAWSPSVECPTHIFTGNAVPMGWDFSESNLLADSSGTIYQTVENIYNNIMASIIPSTNPSSPQLADACSSPLPTDSVRVWFTDPPYYFAVPYADISDFFFVWFKRILLNDPLMKDPFDKSNTLTPKELEITEMAHWDKVRWPNKDQNYFEKKMGNAFKEGCRVLRDDGIGCVVFAHKTTEGWEALLAGMLKGGLVIYGSWPIATERYSRVRARNSAALATSIHLICRPRPEEAPVGEWVDILNALPKRVGDWMERLQNEGVRGADLVFACIGPALEIFSKYSRVETADGRVVDLPEYLSKVWEVVGRQALEQILGTTKAIERNGTTGALEEDARLTALFLWTLQSTVAEDVEIEEDDEEESGDDEDEEEDNGSKKKKGGYTLIFDVVRRFSQPLGINLPKWEDRIISTEKGVVRLLPVQERAKQLFGDEGAQAMADRIEEKPSGPIQLTLFTEEAAFPEIKGRKRSKKGSDISDEDLKTRHEATTLDKVHAAMLLQSSGRTNALRALIENEQNRGPEFIRLANALSALYPKKSEEKRLLDAMILSAPR